MRRLVTPGWLGCHALAAVLFGGCLALAWWQISRAAGGNTLSWAYAVEWPIFAGFVIFIWVREMRRAVGRDRPGDGPAATVSADGIRRPVLTVRRPSAVDDQHDPELVAYNHYLAWLNANPGARPADYRRADNGPAESRRAVDPPVPHIVEEETWAQPSSGTA